MPIARETEREAYMLDEFADVMGHEYRRRILFSLHCEEETPLSVSEDLRYEEPDQDRFLTTMIHVHLPKLESSGLIDWDRERNTIHRGEHFESVDPLLEVLEMYYDYIVPISDSSQKA